jgi:hypothetical protein
MTHPAIIKATGLIQAGDIVAAEAALTALVETEGDTALVEVLDDMPSKDLLAVIREYDSSRESILNLLITPEQFARAVVLERLYGDVSHEHLRGMINSVIFREDANAREFLGAIVELDGGCEALADYLSNRAEEVVGEFDALEIDDLPREEVSDHDWKELTWLLRHEQPEVYDIVHKLLMTQVQNRIRAEAEEAESEDAPTYTDQVVTKVAAKDDDVEDDDESAI